MATKDEEDKLIEELKKALKEDPPGLKSIKEAGKAIGEKIKNNKKS